MLAPFSDKSRRAKIVIDSGRSLYMLSKKDFSSGELEALRRSRNPITVVTTNGEVHTREETQGFVHDLDLFVTVQFPEDTPAVLSLARIHLWVGQC